MTIEIKSVTGSGSSDEDTIVTEVQPPAGEIWYVDTITITKDPWDDYNEGSSLNFSLGIIPEISNPTTGVNDLGGLSSAKSGTNLSIGDNDSVRSANISAYIDDTEKIVLGDESFDQGVGYEYVIHIRRVF